MEKSHLSAAPNDPPQPPAVAAYVRAGLKSFAAHGQPYECHIPSIEGLDAYAGLFGLENLEGKPIIRTFYMNTIDGNYEFTTEQEVLPFSVTVEQLLQNIATSKSGLADHPNDFEVGITVQLNETTCVSFGLDEEEIVGICDHCSAGGYDDANFGCGHGVDEYRIKSWLIISSPKEVDEIDWERGELR